MYISICMGCIMTYSQHVKLENLPTNNSPSTHRPITLQTRPQTARVPLARPLCSQANMGPAQQDICITTANQGPFSQFHHTCILPLRGCTYSQTTITHNLQTRQMSKQHDRCVFAPCNQPFQSEKTCPASGNMIWVSMNRNVELSKEKKRWSYWWRMDDTNQSLWFTPQFSRFQIKSHVPRLIYSHVVSSRL
jgi:hypothetical protein